VSAEFDRFAGSYDEDLAKSLAITGESRDFYAQRRIDWTAECVVRLGQPVHRILDYGCGDGTNSPMLAAKFAAEQVLGVDVSAASIDMARGSYDGAGLSFLHRDEWIPDASVDLAFCNGVFHHIAPVDRGECLTAIRPPLGPEACLLSGKTIRGISARVT
jgi:trans-aconitate methyltransferase